MADAARVSIAELAEMWHLTPRRVQQFAAQGRITKGTDGLFNLAEALAFHHATLADDPGRTLLQSYGNRYGTVTPPKMDEHGIVVPTFGREAVEGMLRAIFIEAFRPALEATARRIDDPLEMESASEVLRQEMAAGGKALGRVANRFGYFRKAG